MKAYLGFDSSPCRGLCSQAQAVFGSIARVGQRLAGFFVFLALALALGLPLEIEHREQIIAAAFGVVAFSIFAQGLTMTPLLRKLKEIPK